MKGGWHENSRLEIPPHGFVAHVKIPTFVFFEDVMDKVWQLLIPIAYRLAKCYWFVARPASRGAYVAVWADHRLLVIRNSYKTAFSLPSGGVDSGETFAEAAVRELREEIGIHTSEDQLIRIGSFASSEEYKRDVSEVFELHLNTTPTIRIDNREVVYAEFLSETQTQDLPLVSIVAQWMESRKLPQQSKPKLEMSVNDSDSR